MKRFLATGVANGTSITSTVNPTIVTSTGTATATSAISQQDAQNTANAIAQQIADRAAQNDANIISQTVNYITSNGIAGPTRSDGSTGPTGPAGLNGTNGVIGPAGPAGPAGGSSPTLTNTVYFNNTDDMNNFTLPPPDTSGSRYYNVLLSGNNLGYLEPPENYQALFTNVLQIYNKNSSNNTFLYGSIFTDPSATSFNNILKYTQNQITNELTLDTSFNVNTVTTSTAISPSAINSVCLKTEYNTLFMTCNYKFLYNYTDKSPIISVNSNTGAFINDISLNRINTGTSPSNAINGICDISGGMLIYGDGSTNKMLLDDFATNLVFYSGNINGAAPSIVSIPSGGTITSTSIINYIFTYTIGSTNYLIMANATSFNLYSFTYTNGITLTSFINKIATQTASSKFPMNFSAPYQSRFVPPLFNSGNNNIYIINYGICQIYDGTTLTYIRSLQQNLGVIRAISRIPNQPYLQIISSGYNSNPNSSFIIYDVSLNTIKNGAILINNSSLTSFTSTLLQNNIIASAGYISGNPYTNFNINNTISQISLFNLSNIDNNYITVKDSSGNSSNLFLNNLSNTLYYNGTNWSVISSSNLPVV